MNKYRIFIILFVLLMLGKTVAQLLSDSCIISRGTDPDIQVGQDSTIHVSWASVGEDPNQRYAYYQQFNLNGIPKSESIKVSENMGVQYTFLTLGKDRLIICWRQVMMTFKSYILGQILDDSGYLIESNFYVNDEDFISDFERVPFNIIPFKDSIFCVLWNGDGYYSSEDAIYGQYISDISCKIDSNFMISDFPDLDYKPVGGRGDFNKDTGLFITVWTDQRDSTHRVYGRLFDCDGKFTGPSVLFSDKSITEDIYYPHAFWESDSTLTLFYWAGMYKANIYYQRFTISGEPLTPPIQINEIEGDVSDYTVSKDKDGRLIVIWTNDDCKQIYAQRVDSDLSFIGNNFIITSGSYYLIYRMNIDIRDGIVYTVFNDYPYEIYLNIFDYDNPPVGIDEDNEKEIPEEFVLYQNYPNPFNLSTSISFKVNETSNVKIIIYDILGNQVRLITDKQHTPGYYTIQWDGKNDDGISTTSGIYLVKAFLPSKNYTKKMVLIK